MAYGPDTEKLFAKIAKNSKYLYANDLNITSLPLLPDTIIGIWLNNSKIKRITVLPPKLEILVCEYSSLESLCSLPATLVMLNVAHTNLKDLPELPIKLRSLNVSGCSFPFLPLMPPSLTDVYCFGNTLVGLKPYCILIRPAIVFCNNLWAELQSKKRVCDRVATYKEDLIAKVLGGSCGYGF